MAMVVMPASGGGSIDGATDLRSTCGERHRRASVHIDRIRLPVEPAIVRHLRTDALRVLHQLFIGDGLQRVFEALAPVLYQPGEGGVVTSQILEVVAEGIGR